MGTACTSCIRWPEEDGQSLRFSCPLGSALLTMSRAILSMVIPWSTVIMQRITSFATCRDLAGLAAALFSKTVQPWKRTSRSASYAPTHQQSTKLPFGQSVRGLRRPRIAVPPFAGHVHRLYGTAGEERGSKNPVITVVGIPDPITWIRCKCDILIIELLFELGLGSKEFENGVKQVTE